MGDQVAGESSAYMCQGRAEAGSRSRASLRAFMRTESGSAGLLVAAALVALVWANSPWSDSYEELWRQPFSIMFGSGSISMDLHHWVNDGLMVVFFFVVGLEVRREFSIGELTERSRLTVPVVAGIGGMLVPAALYLALNPSGEAARGWGAVIGTDTAFLLGMLALVGPSVSTQLRIFLLTLTVIDDVVAVTVIGVIYSDDLNVGPLLVAGGCLVVLFVLDRTGIWRASPYVTVLVVLWLATVESGVHASIAGMLSGLLVPALEPDRKIVEEAARQGKAFRQSPLPGLQKSARVALNRAVSVNERLQEVLHGWTSYVIVPVFALANAGVDLRDGVLGRSLASPVTWGIVIGLVVGKMIGIGVGAAVAERFRWGTLPEGVQSGHVLAGGALSGIGFTVSLLIVSLAFTDPEIQQEAIVGVLLSAVLASVAGWAMFTLAATLWGHRDAALPTRLAVPIDPDLDHVRGRADAPLTLVEYFDFECPFCARATGSADEVRAALGDRLRYVARHMPLDQHPNAVPAAIAAEAAHRQGRFWEMHDLLFARQDRLTDDDLVAAATDLGLDVGRFVADLADEDLLGRVQRDADGAALSGVRGTPTFFIGETRHEGPFDARALIAALEADARR